MSRTEIQQPLRCKPKSLVLVGLAAGCLSLSACQPPPTVTLEATYTEGLAHPSDMIHLQGQWWVTELFGGRLSSMSRLGDAPAAYLPPEGGLSSPHFLSLLSGQPGYLYTSEGWGKHIAGFDLQQTPPHTTRFNYPAASLHAPHGICEKDGWLYIADSLNSRLVRVDVATRENWQVFPDPQKRIAYGRGLACHDDGVYLANSHEKREGLNPGEGGNILRIEGFEQGKMALLYAFPDSFVADVEKLSERYLLVSQWVPGRNLVLVDLKKGSHQSLARPGPEFGAPYGIFRKEDRLYVAYTGDIHGKTHLGGIAVYRLD